MESMAIEVWPLSQQYAKMTQIDDELFGEKIQLDTDLNNLGLMRQM
jgi:hypothetical protein